MPTHNKDIAVIFGQVADLLEIEGANPFRVRAYREGARIFGKLSQRVADLIAEGKDLTEISGIGDDLAAKAEEIVDTGGLKQLEQLHKRLPADLSELLRIPGLGPKKVKILYEELDIKNLESLKKAAVSKAIRKLDGFGAKSEANILREIQNRSWGRPRTPWAEAAQTARDLRNYLAAESGVKQIDLAGSFRRKKETVGDLDILVSCKRGTKIMARFVAYEDVQRVLARGKTKSSVLLRSGLQVDLRKLPQVGYGAGLHYFTGAKAHNIAVRKLGRQKGLKINEYGVYEADRRIAGKSEKSVFAAVELPYIPPELRENRGEMQAARAGRLPELIRLADIRGDLHAHTRETDGRNTLEEMAKAARERGYDYLAVTNHSQQVRVARGMDETRLAESLEAMEALNAQMKDFRILKSVEVDILKDGSLDLPGEILKALDLTVCAVHSAFDLSREQQTERILRAMDNPHFSILAHPTGRLINRREPYAVDLMRLIEAAAQRGCTLELNAHPERLDLDAEHCQAAREQGVKIAISTDAHSSDNLNYMALGINQARRGWLEAADVLNTRGWPELKKLLRR